MIDTCPGCMWVGAPTTLNNVYLCTTWHCRVDRYLTRTPVVAVA